MAALLTRLDRRPALLLALGGVLLVLSQVSGVVALLAWIAPVPFLRFLRVTSGLGARLSFFGALIAAWTLAVFKIASEPMFFAMAPLFSVPLALAQGTVYLVWDRFRRGVTPGRAALFFALGLGVEEAALYTLTELGSWGATGYTQLGDLALLQAASVVGVAGVGVLVSAVAATLEAGLASEGPGRWRPLGIALAAVLLVHVLGAARLTWADRAAHQQLSVAMIATDSDVGGLPLPSRDTTHAWDEALLERSRRAAAAGAELVVWTEAATLVWTDEEAAWIEALRRTADEADVDIVAGYVVPVATDPLTYRNEFRLALRDGTLVEPYAKYHPVPGEPAVAGRDPAPIFRRPWGNLSGAICYDYDFPPMATARARLGADLVAVPASDWRGIDPVHGEMASVRAIEAGHAIVRSTRWGLSVAADPYGRIRAWRSAFEPGPSITVAMVPHERIPTPYTWLGDVPLLCLFMVVLVDGLRRARSRSRSVA